MTAQQYLESILSKYSIDEGKMERLKNIRKEVENDIRAHYGSHAIESIRYSGSYAKGTAVNLNYDLDICIYFKNNSFNTLKEMFDDTGRFLRSTYPKYNVRKQRVSWGLELMDGRSLDIVPARSLGNGTGDAYLYSSDNTSYIKTNITKHKEYISASGDRPIIKLMKIWKIEHNVHFKSFALELLVIKALQNFESKDYSDRMWKVLNYIKNNAMTVNLIDPANSANIVSNTVPDSDKRALYNQANSSLSKRTWQEIIW